MSSQPVQHFFAKHTSLVGFSKFNAYLLTLLCLAFGLVAVKDWNRRLLRDYQKVSASLDHAKIHGETLLLEKNALLSEDALSARQKREKRLHFPSAKERFVLQVHKQGG